MTYKIVEAVFSEKYKSKRKVYFFKYSPEHYNLSIDDYAVVETDSGLNYGLVKIVKILDNPTDYEKSIATMWIIDVVDFENYNTVVKMEEQIVELDERISNVIKDIPQDEVLKMLAKSVPELQGLIKIKESINRG